MIIQARTDSARLPRKVLKPLGNNYSVLSFLVSRIKLSRLTTRIIVSTTDLESDDILASHCKKLNVPCFRGNATNVLERYFKTVEFYGGDNIVRITADCPFVDPFMLDSMLDIFQERSSSYMCNQFPVNYPDGFDIDIFTSDLLREAFQNATEDYDLEHVTPYMKRFVGDKILGFKPDSDYSYLRVTLDEYEDLTLLRVLVEKLGNRIDFKWNEVVSVLEKNPELVAINKSLSYNYGVKTPRGSKLYSRAKQIIPGGNSLLSKRPEMFLPDQWPNYYSKAKGINVWDLDNKMYTDMCIMGIGTNILGYAYDPVDNRVIRAIQDSNMSTLNPPEEVFLAERLLDLHPWFNMARFARTGAEINAIALRIARAASGKSKVAICGYHGWHDWYLANNIASNDSLKNHLLPGLSAIGVPKALGSEVVSFKYNDFEQMRNTLQDDDLGVVFMEVMRSDPPSEGFLEEIRAITTRRGIVLIFDECTSGFRQSFGGLHATFGIYPDIATFGKALGNGFAITAALGTESVMSYANETFMSSTFWTERVGFVAALATLDAMEELESWKSITETGNTMFEIWRKLALSHQIPIKLMGIPALAAHSFPGDDFVALKTFVTQEMLLRYSTLASNIFYPSTAHSFDNLRIYSEQLDEIFGRAKKLIGDGSLERHINGPVAHSTFSRLN